MPQGQSISSVLGERIERSESRIALIGLPFDARSSFMRGPAEAPSLIREALYSEAGNLSTEYGHDLGSGSPILDLGDLDLGSVADHEPPIRAAIEAVLRHDLRPLSLGGDHSVSLPAIEAIAAKHAAVDVLQFDAHPDLYDRFQDSPASHACVFARVMERGLARRLVQVGVRTLNPPQREQVERFGVEVIEMRRWDHVAALTFEGPLYVTIDLDVLDPAYAPGVSHREPGGASTRQLIDALQSLDAPIVGADVVEFNPRRDPARLTAPVGAKLVKELAAQMLDTPPA